VVLTSVWFCFVVKWRYVQHWNISMSAPESALQGSRPTYKATPEQQVRERTLRRFNRLVVSVPLAILVVAVAALTGYLLWTVFTHSPESQAYRFLSGLADLILILTILPMLLVCAVGPALLGYMIYAGVNRRKLKPGQRRSKLQILFWRVDRFIDTVQARLSGRYLTGIARPLIAGHATVAAVRRLLQLLRHGFRK
jgi:hypothetical protein